MAQRRVPWVKIRIDLSASEKVAGLPGAEVLHPAWGWTCVLLAAKTQRRMGVFAGRGHLASAVSQAAPFVEDYVTAGLLHVAPLLCADCARRHVDDDLKSGELVVHDYLGEQRDPSNADRQALHRERLKGDVTASSVTTEPSADLSTPDGVTGTSVTPDPAPARPTGRNGNVTADSRARGTTVTTTATETTEKKDVSEGTVVEGNGGSTRELVDEAPFLSDPNRAGRPGASTAHRPLAVPPAIAALTPKWRHPCSNYVGHQSQHRLVDGQAVCPVCEEAAGFEPGNGAPPVEPAGLWGPIQ